MKIKMPVIKGIKSPIHDIKSGIKDVLSGNVKSIGRTIEGGSSKVYKMGQIEGGSNKVNKPVVNDSSSLPASAVSTSGNVVDMVKKHSSPLHIYGTSGDDDNAKGDFIKDKEEKRNVVFNISIGNMAKAEKGSFGSYKEDLHGSECSKKVANESYVESNKKEIVDVKPNHVVYVNPEKYKDRIIEVKPNHMRYLNSKKYLDRVVDDKGRSIAFNRVYDPVVGVNRFEGFAQSGRDVIMGKRFQHHNNDQTIYLKHPLENSIERRMGKLVRF